MFLFIFCSMDQAGGQGLKVESKREDLNPWAVQSLEDFLHYCCPECDEKKQSRESFINHAMLHHPQVKQGQKY